MLRTLTHGVMPTFEEFEAAFDAECPNGYNITLGRTDSDACENFRLGDGKWEARELYDACVEIVEYVGKDYPADEDSDRDDAAMDLVSGILQTLGFEWI